MESWQLANLEFHTSQRLLKQAGGFYSARYNFIKELEIVGRGATASYLMFGSGPFINIHYEKFNQPKKGSLEFDARLCVFEETGTHVGGIEYLGYADFMIWGGSYFTFLNLHKLVLGGIICRKDILSAGKQIATVKAFNNPKSAGYYVIEFYFVDGTMQEIVACPGIRHEELVTLYNTYRIPLKSGEIISAAYTASLGTYLGTNRGRLIWVKNTKVQFLTEPILDSAIKQIVIPHSTVNANVAALLLFENGTIVSRKDKKHMKKLEGRYTYISDFVFELSDDFAKREKYILAGDRDGTVTVIRVDNGYFEIFRTFKNRTFSAITSMLYFNRSYTILGTEAGELQYFDMSQLYRERPYCQPGVKATKSKTNGPPSCVVESDYYYKASVGWFFLKDDKFCKSVLDNKTQKYTALLEAKKLKMKYYLACGLPDREIAVAYNSCDIAVCVTDYTPRIPRLMIKTFETPGSPFRIKQVIIMATHVLLQHDSGNAQLLMFNTTGEELISIPRLFKTPARITAAACIEYDRNYEISILYPYDFMITYLDGSADVHNINWNSDGTLKYTTSYPYAADLKGSYFVSAISSGEHIGNMQSLLLSRKGIVYLAVKGQWLGQKEQIYTTIVQQDLSGILGNGHSLMETYVGILATGFKRHTLNVCRLFMGVKKARTYCHLFSVDTRSSRLPYTVIEEKRRSDHPVIGRETTQQLIVSYYNKSGAITEERFSQYCTHFTNGTKHTGIITNCFVQDIFRGIKEHFYSGDTNGNFCIWSFDEKAVTGQTYLNAFKMNGAVTAIQDIYPYTAVSTSQGDLHLFKLVNIESIQLQPTIPDNLGQKITRLTSGQNPISSQHFLLAFLEDGSVQHIKLDNSRMHESEVEQIVRRKKVAKLPVPTKMATCWCLKNVYYILALGTDGILRRTQLSPSRNTTIEMKWKISVIKEFDLGMHILLAGDPEGWVYMLINDQRMGSNFHIDRLHKQEVIDVVYHSPSSRECFLFSMDVSGTVVIRQVLSKMRPVIWACAVPSPRKIIVVEKQRKIMVIGRGVAARSY